MAFHILILYSMSYSKTDTYNFEYQPSINKSFLNVLILDTEYRVTMKRLVLGINVETFDGKVPDRVGTWKSTQEFQKLSEEKLGFSSVSFRRNATEAEVRADFQCLKEQLCEDYGSDIFRM